MKNLRHKAQRVAVFIDVQNLYYSAKNLFKSRVNFEEVLDEAISKRQLIRALAYVIRSKEVEKEESFFEALKNFGIELKIKDLQVFSTGLKKGDWDVGLTTDAISISQSVDTIVLVTGDGDFVPLVEYLKSHGKQVEVLAFSKSASLKLKEAANEFIDLGENPKKYLIKNH